MTRQCAARGRGMSPEGYSSITVPDEVFEQGTTAMIEYDYKSVADVVATASAVAEPVTYVIHLKPTNPKDQSVI